jgi:hypothetical protein
VFYRAKLEKCIEAAQPFFKEKITVETLKTRSKLKKYVRPRFFIMGMLFKNSHLSGPQIAKMLGLKDHTSVLNGVNRANEIWGEIVLRQAYDQIFEKEEFENRKYTFVNGEGWVLKKDYQARLDEEL